ncbi:Transmembrane protein [Phytophthora megakarya]|uniref:Transmembrane protein n=1 Tax=Phytophthora megakarya TaxID=4795 RepID=A0A225V9C5_9STRA|nr:Transmembrane protein [Phytophthora megakarya]
MKGQVVLPHEALDKDDAAYWSRQLVVPSRSRQASRFWLEKALVVTDGVQLYALMWQLSQPWPWPARWLEATRWTNAFTLDFFSFRATGAAMGSSFQSFCLWGEMSSYWVYALLWALVPWTGALTLQIAKRRWTRQGRSDFLLLSVTWENVLLQMLQLLYVPVGLAVLRLVNCNADGAVSVDPMGMTCGSVGHVAAVLTITCGLGGSFLLGLPWILCRRIRESLVHSSVEKHEEFMQGKEMEFMLGTSDSYLELYMPQFASFRRHSVEIPVHMCLLKLSLMFIFSILRSPPPSTKNQGMQGSLFFLIMASMAVFRTWRFPYRCVSTTSLALLVDWMLVANGVFVLLCANGVHSALTVSTSVTSSLTFLNLCFLVVISMMELRDVILFYVHPEIATKKKLHWPTNEHMKEIVENGLKVDSWVKAIHHAQGIILASHLVTPSMRSCEDLKAALDQVEHCYEEAAKNDHLLMGQLYEVSLDVHELYVDAVASSPFHRSGFPANELIDFSGVLQRRKDRQLLFSMQSQRILRKLHIARSWSRRAQPYASASVGWNQKRRATAIQRFLADESNCHQGDSAAADWKPVNSIFCLKQVDGNDSEFVVSVLAWSESLDLVKWCAMKDSRPEKSSQEQYFSLVTARKAGIRGKIVSCGYTDSSTAILHALDDSSVIQGDIFRSVLM